MSTHDLIAGYRTYTTASALRAAPAAPSRSTWPTPWTNPITTTVTAPTTPSPGTTLAP